MRFFIIFLFLFCAACEREKVLYLPKDFYNMELPKPILRNDKEIFGTKAAWYEYHKLSSFEYSNEFVHVKYDISVFNDYYFLEPYLIVNKQKAIEFINSQTGYNKTIYLNISQLRPASSPLTLSTISLTLQDILAAEGETIKVYFLDNQSQKLSLKRNFYILTLGPIHFDLDFRKI